MNSIFCKISVCQVIIAAPHYTIFQVSSKFYQKHLELDEFMSLFLMICRAYISLPTVEY